MMVLAPLDINQGFTGCVEIISAAITKYAEDTQKDSAVEVKNNLEVTIHNLLTSGGSGRSETSSTML